MMPAHRMSKATVDDVSSLDGQDLACRSECQLPLVAAHAA